MCCPRIPTPFTKTCRLHRAAKRKQPPDGLVMLDHTSHPFLHRPKRPSLLRVVQVPSLITMLIMIIRTTAQAQSRRCHRHELGPPAEQSSLEVLASLCARPEMKRQSNAAGVDGPPWRVSIWALWHGRLANWKSLTGCLRLQR
ncbi:hypothetical protein DM02DRAFT_224590 [Periconia macrospinosa]|uniref:Uncharacterized protein n=1 Tax=Periconia macrospinosa TaxID=97972 RepID=A0A2V1E0M2_9PLEO|nr:hypothetical protein DM02DRAFT_224590 [Periconia macrospinosa]